MIQTQSFPLLFPPRINPSQEDKNSSDRFLDTQKWKYQHHTDWVTAVKYIEDMNCVVAASLDKLVSITDAGARPQCCVRQSLNGDR